MATERNNLLNSGDEASLTPSSRLFGDVLSHTDAHRVLTWL